MPMLTDEQLFELINPKGTSMVAYGRSVERAVLEQVLQKLESELKGKIKVDDCVGVLGDHRDWLREVTKGGQG